MSVGVNRHMSIDIHCSIESNGWSSWVHVKNWQADAISPSVWKGPSRYMCYWIILLHCIFVPSIDGWILCQFKLKVFHSFSRNNTSLFVQIISDKSCNCCYLGSIQFSLDAVRCSKFRNSLPGQLPLSISTVWQMAVLRVIYMMTTKILGKKFSWMLCTLYTGLVWNCIYF